MGLPKRKPYKWDLTSPELEKHKKNRGMIWESQNGRQTEIQHMDINHLKNCIAKIKREDDWKIKYLNILEMELIFREVHKLNVTGVLENEINKFKLTQEKNNYGLSV